MFCRHVKETMSVAGNVSAAFGLNANKYCYDFAVMKFIIADASKRQDYSLVGTSAYRPVPVSWETVSIAQISSGKNLEPFQPGDIAAAASLCMFNRSDLAVMLSCFACLWQEVVEKFINTSMIDLDSLTEYLGSPEAAESVAAYTEKYGYPPHPCTVVSQYIEQVKCEAGEQEGEQPKKKRKRVREEMEVDLDYF